MPNTPPPLLGFNNNVRHRGRVFHIQTEDSGIKSPRIVTHLFADGGRIVRTARTDYSEHVGRDDMAQVVRKLMKDQHKAMFIALRAGELDDIIVNECGLSLGPEVARPSGELVLDSSPSAAPAPLPEMSEPPPRSRTLSNPNLRRVIPSVPPPPAGSIELDVDSLDKNPPPPPPPRAPRIRTPSPAERYAPSRPAAIFGDAPPDSRSIFGDKVISEKSLDEVILSYLAEDLDGPPPSK